MRIFISFLRRLKEDFSKPEVKGLFFTALFTVLLGSFFYHYVEGWSFLDSFYFSVSTLATVGMGDLVPSSDLSKLFTSFYMLVGIGILFGFVSMIGREVTSFYIRNGKDKKDEDN